MSETTTTITLEEKIEWIANKIRHVMRDGSEPGTATDGAPLTGNNLIKDRAARMKAVSMAYDILKPVMDELDKEYDRLRKSVIPDLMAENDVRTVTFEGIGRVQLAGDCYASIPADKQPEAFEWLRGHGHGDLIKETVNSSTLKAWAKEGLEQGRELPEGVFKVEPFQRASIVKVAGKKKTADAR